MRLDLDSPVICIDSPFGELADVVIEPSARRVTHLVVQKPDRHDSARLVPIARARVDERSDGGISLDCTVAEVDKQRPVHRSDYVRLGERPVEDPDSAVGIEETFELPPYQSLGVDTLGSGVGPIDFDPHATISYDRIPKGTVEIRGSSDVTSADGHHVGHLVALVLDEHDQITDLVLEHGHLWSKRQISIPVGSIDRIASDEVVLTLSNDEIRR